MKLFRCDTCGHTLYFENSVCANCGRAQGYLAATNAMVALAPQNGGWIAERHPESRLQYCANAAHAACNWLVQDAAGPDALCTACAHNETIPDLGADDNLAHWQTIERAKKRLFYSLIRFGLPLASRADDPDSGLAFRFLADNGGEAVMTGHAQGIVTIALAEADDAEREARRSAMGEPYRTLLGHFRHELAHYYWDVLVDGHPAIERCRAIFGDERADYGAALEAHYRNGAPPDWPESYVSSYATAHPWEDFAETWAHYFHLVDTVETASAFGVSIAPKIDRTGNLSTEIDFDPYRPHPIQTLVDHWVPLGLMLNNLNRAIGQPDAYPFVLTPAIIEKLGFIAELIHGPALADQAPARAS